MKDWVAIPKGIDAVTLARIFNAYLMGMRARDNQDDQFGPYETSHDEENSVWQLDSSNDYWLHVHGNTAHFTWRYKNCQRRIEAAVDLFNATYIRD